MRRVLNHLAIALALYFTVAAAGNAPRCDFTQAVAKCDATKQSACDHWQCLHEQCHNEITLKAMSEHCTAQVPGPYRTVSAVSKTTADGSDRRHHAAHSGKHAVAVAPNHKMLPMVNSPCLGGGAQSWGKDKIHAHLYKVAMDVYNERAHETYSEDMTLRWVGIHDHICPAAVPKTSDCSSMVTWVYWTLFGNGPDFLNAENWGAGYTGTLDQHGVNIANPGVGNLEVGDLCFYYTPMHHTAIYVGDGKVVSHGMDPVGYYPWDYAQVDFCRRYL